MTLSGLCWGWYAFWVLGVWLDLPAGPVGFLLGGGWLSSGSHSCEVVAVHFTHQGTMFPSIQCKK